MSGQVGSARLPDAICSRAREAPAPGSFKTVRPVLTHHASVHDHHSTGATMATAASTASPLTLPPLPYPENALEPVISAKTSELSLWQASQDLRRNHEQADRGHRACGLAARANRDLDGGQARAREHFQQCGAGLEPLVLLAVPEGQGRRRAAGGAEAEDGGGFRQRRRLQEGAFRRGGGAVRQRLGVARSRGRQAQGAEDRRCRNADHAGRRGRS